VVFFTRNAEQKEKKGKEGGRERKNHRRHFLLFCYKNKEREMGGKGEQTLWEYNP